MSVYRVPKPFSFALWREADLLSLALMTLNGHAALGLVFKNPAGAAKLFSYWHDVIGQRDEQNLLRFALVFGEAPKVPPGYFFRLGPHHDVIEALTAAAMKSGNYQELDVDAEALSTMTRHMPTANPKSPHMTAFLDAYLEHDAFIVGAMKMEKGAPVPLQETTPLIKRGLVIKELSQLKPGDPDLAVLELFP